MSLATRFSSAAPISNSPAASRAFPKHGTSSNRLNTSSRGGTDPHAARRQRFAEHMARQWGVTLAPAGNTRGPLEVYLRAEACKNTSFDQLARNLLTATGDANGPVPRRSTSRWDLPRNALPNQWAAACLACDWAVHSVTITRLRPGRRKISGASRPFPAPLEKASSMGAATTIQDGKKEYPAKFLDGPAPKFVGREVQPNRAGRLAGDLWKTVISP